MGGHLTKAKQSGGASNSCRRFIPGIRLRLSPKAPSAPTLSRCVYAFRRHPESTAFRKPLTNEARSIERALSALRGKTARSSKSRNVAITVTPVADARGADLRRCPKSKHCPEAASQLPSGKAKNRTPWVTLTKLCTRSPDIRCPHVGCMWRFGKLLHAAISVCSPLIAPANDQSSPCPFQYRSSRARSDHHN